MSVKVKLTKSKVKEAEEFAGLRCSDSSVDTYKKRGGFKKEDILAGALGELAIYVYLKASGVKCPKPDFTIHEKGKKSFSADLNVGNYKMHVKAQTLDSEKKYGQSWLMQRYDPCLKNPDKDYIVLTTVDIENSTVYIHGFFSLKAVVENSLVGECKVPAFRTNKVALYLKDINEGLAAHHKWGLVPRLRGVKC
jgi:hypothetical protein